MIELALLYAPEDESYRLYRETIMGSGAGTGHGYGSTTSQAGQVGGLSAHQHPSLTIPSVSLDSDDVVRIMTDMIDKLCVYIHTLAHTQTPLVISPARAEVILNHYGWDLAQAQSALLRDPLAVCKAVHLDPQPVCSYLYTNAGDEGECGVGKGESKSDGWCTPDPTTMTPYTAVHRDTMVLDEYTHIPSTTTTTTTTSGGDAGKGSEEAAICAICGECMLPPLPLSQLYQQFQAVRNDPTSNLYEQFLLHTITCGSGHSYCLCCWSTHTRTQVIDRAAFTLSCPG